MNNQRLGGWSPNVPKFQKNHWQLKVNFCHLTLSNFIGMRKSSVGGSSSPPGLGLKGAAYHGLRPRLSLFKPSGLERQLMICSRPCFNRDHNFGYGPKGLNVDSRGRSPWLAMPPKPKAGGLEQPSRSKQILLVDLMPFPLRCKTVPLSICILR
mgnify:CR=1 FL=1